MRTITIELLEQLREVIGARSNRDIARALEISPRTVNGYKNSGNRMSELVAFRAATILGRSPQLVFVMLAAERTKNPQIARMWRRYGRAWT